MKSREVHSLRIRRKSKACEGALNHPRHICNNEKSRNSRLGYLGQGTPNPTTASNKRPHQPQLKPNSAPGRPQINPTSSPKRHRIGPDSPLERCPNRFDIDLKSTPVRPQIGPTGFPSKDGTGRSTGVKRASVKDGCSCVRAC